MDPSAIPVFLAGPSPVLHTSRVQDSEQEVELDIALLISGVPTMLAATRFPLDDTWERIQRALSSGDARLGVAGMPHEAESITGTTEIFPSAYVGLECANGERESEAYARSVIAAILDGKTPAELGEPIED